MLNCDFHCHSTISDGLLAPADLVRRAAGNGVDVLALTDHDAIGGLDIARAAAVDAGIRFVNGVEISIEWNETSIHIVGLGFDPQSQELANGLAEIRGGRIDRAERMAAELARIGIEDTFNGAMKFAEDPTLISRAHFARHLVERGVCPDVRRVFENYLVPGKPGYVDHRWASLADSLRWIHAAGGVAVVAHPARYKVNLPSMRCFLGEFRDRGGEAIEVTSGSHTPEQTQLFARIAREFGFFASRGSDFHGPDESYTDLGKLPALPEDLKPVWEALGL